MNFHFRMEVEIQVYEEDKGLKRVFKCPQNLLVSNMPYFFEINKGTKENHIYIRNTLFPSDMLVYDR